MTLPRSTAAGLHVRYEKVGMILDSLPIPWNADAVIVEANVNPPAATPLDKQAFTLQLMDGTTASAEVILPSEKKKLARVFFRIPTPAQSAKATILWRDHQLGEADIPVIQSDDFLRGLTVSTGSVVVGFKDGQSAACSAFVLGQPQSLCASIVLASETPLAPLADLSPRVDFERAECPTECRVVTLTSSQLRARQAMLTVFLPKARGLGDHWAYWNADHRSFHVKHLSVVSKKEFLGSLRITATRFIVERAGAKMEVVRWLPANLTGIIRVAPCFYVRSSIAGVAGLAKLILRSIRSDGSSGEWEGGDTLVTDGPSPFVPIIVNATELASLKHFTLESAAGKLGNLPLVAAPTADVAAEGGMAPLDEFVWSAAAEEQLNNMLGKLLGDG